jgi:hypothetical protein
MSPFILFIIMTFCGFAHKEQDCKCIPAKTDETTYWGGNELIAYKEEANLKSLSGTVLLPPGEPMQGALVEVFSPPGDMLSQVHPPPKKEPRRVAACKTDAKGRFCFQKIAIGTYELRISKDEYGAWNPTHILITINPKDRKSVRKQIEIWMNLGT